MSWTCFSRLRVYPTTLSYASQNQVRNSQIHITRHRGLFSAAHESLSESTSGSMQVVRLSQSLWRVI